MLTIATPEQVDQIRELDALEFPDAEFPGYSSFWVLHNDPEHGYCGAAIGWARTLAGNWTGPPCVHLTRAVVGEHNRGLGFQTAMIDHRLDWGAGRGAVVAQTYTGHDNIPSMRNLIRAGFLPMREADGFIRWEREL